MAPINARLTIESGVGPLVTLVTVFLLDRRHLAISAALGSGFRLTRFDRPTIVAASEGRLGRREAFSGLKNLCENGPRRRSRTKVTKGAP